MGKRGGRWIRASYEGGKGRTRGERVFGRNVMERSIEQDSEALRRRDMGEGEDKEGDKQAGEGHSW